MKDQYVDKLITEALIIEEKEAIERGALGYMARAMVQATMPHRKLDSSHFSRKNGLFTLNIVSLPNVGLPYGSIPRLLLAWISTEAVIKKDKHLVLGETLSSFMNELDLNPSGGKRGGITCLKDQMKRLFSSSISCTYDNGKHWAIQTVNPLTKASLWWDHSLSNESFEFKSTLTLTEEFYQEITHNPVPIDFRTLKALKKSPLALDIYCWLTYRLSYLKNPTLVPWGGLQLQFGSDYAQNEQGARNFKKAFLRELNKVILFYPNAKIELVPKGILLKESYSHIKNIHIK